MVMKTAVFKIHNPSKHKQAVIDYAMKQYTLAYDYLLKFSKDNLEDIKEKCKYNNQLSVNNIATYIGKSTPVINHFQIHGSLKESLFLDVAGTICSYIQLKEQDENTSFPRARRVNDLEEYYTYTLERLRISTVDLAEENEIRDDLLKTTKERFLPLFFSRPDGIVRNRNFGLLYDNDNNKYYAILYLLPNKSRMKKPIQGKSKLQSIHPQKKLFIPSSRKVGSIILPLAFGKWHEETFLKYALENPQAIRTAYLTKKGSEYFLHVSFDFPSEEKVTETYLGIDRGINKLVALSVVTPEGKLLYHEDFSGKEYENFQEKLFKELKENQKLGKQKLKKYSKINEGFIHVIANKIVEVANIYSSQVVLEDLTYLSKSGFKQKTGNKYFDKLMNRRLGRNPYNKLKTILEYKLPLKGLPKPKLVSGHYTSQCCSRCNNVDKRNRPNQATFQCTRCGYKDNADTNASVNIALRGIWWKRGVVKKENGNYIGKYEGITVKANTYKDVIKDLQEKVPIKCYD